MGLARAAELNGYPGPMHVLELSGPLGLSREQVARTEALYASMKARAIEAGRALVEAERELDMLFREQRIDEAKLASALQRVGAHQVDVRRVHLAAHLSQAAILTPPQIARYAELRGYAGETQRPPDDAQHQGHERRH
jgi:hypothetical protein